MKPVEFGTLFQFIRNGMNVKQDKSGDGLPITRIETISDATVDGTRVGFARLAEADCRDWLLEAGDILFSHINSVEHIGKCAVYRGAPEKLVHGMNLLCLRSDTAKLLPEFAKHLIRGTEFRTRLSNFINKAVNQASVSIGNLKTIPVTVPPLAEQRRIAEVLDRAEALRAKRRAALAQFDPFTQSLFLDLFGDPRTNSKAWPTLTLGELGDGPGAIVDGPFGSAINVKEDYIEDGEIPVIRTKNVRPFEFITDDLKRISRTKFTALERSAVVPGDIILTKVGTIGNVCFFPSTFEVGVLSTTGSCRIRPNEKIVQKMYLAHFLHLYRSEMMKLVAEGVQPFLNMRHIKSFRVPIPSLGLQEEFARRVRAVEKLKMA